MDPVVIATWPFGRVAVEAAWPLLAQGEPPLDAVMAGAKAVEDDPNVMSVGFGSLADRIGRLTLDACVMDGKTLDCGAVAGLEHIRSASAVARRVMDKTPHVLLVGEGAKWFALEQGFKLEMPHTAAGVKAWFDKHPHKQPPAGDGAAKPAGGKGPDDFVLPIDADHHDTVTVLALGTGGNLAGVCSTSGLAYKRPGRVGDSPIIGAGLYVDDQAGAAGATGVGEEVIRVGGSLFMAEQMRAGKSPQEACELACRRLIATANRRGVHPATCAFIALDTKGRVGAAATPGTNFDYAVGRPAGVTVTRAKEIAG